MSRKLPVPGDIYQHWKGRNYEVILVGKLEQTSEMCVIYKAIGKEDVWIRPQKEWSDKIDKIEGEPIERFKFVRNKYEHGKDTLQH